MLNPHDTAVAVDKLETLADTAADKMDHALVQGQRAANETIDSLRDKVGELRSSAGTTLHKAADVAQVAMRRGLERAQMLKADVNGRATRLGDDCAVYVREEPVKALLIAGAVGAGLAMLLSRRRAH